MKSCSKSNQRTSVHTTKGSALESNHPQIYAAEGHDIFLEAHIFLKPTNNTSQFNARLMERSKSCENWDAFGSPSKAAVPKPLQGSADTTKLPRSRSFSVSLSSQHPIIKRPSKDKTSSGKGRRRFSMYGWVGSFPRTTSSNSLSQEQSHHRARSMSRDLHFSTPSTRDRTSQFQAIRESRSYDATIEDTGFLDRAWQNASFVMDEDESEDEEKQDHEACIRT